MHWENHMTSLLFVPPPLYQNPSSNIHLWLCFRQVQYMFLHYRRVFPVGLNVITNGSSFAIHWENPVGRPPMMCCPICNDKADKRQ